MDVRMQLKQYTSLNVQAEICHNLRGSTVKLPVIETEAEGDGNTALYLHFGQKLNIQTHNTHTHHDAFSTTSSQGDLSPAGGHLYVCPPNSDKNLITSAAAAACWSGETAFHP